MMAPDRLESSNRTSHRNSLDRAVLKKAKFLHGQVVAPCATTIPEAEPELVAAGVAVAPHEPAPTEPESDAPPLLLPPKPVPPLRERPVVVSAFAEKLQQAWHK